MIEDIKKKNEIAEKMEQYRKSHGISYTFIGNSTDITHSHIRKSLLGEVVLTENTRKKINELWGTDF